MSQQTNFSDNEKKIYQFLYEKPICERIKSNELNVLIVGDNDELEAFRAIFWCGQYPDTTLNITLCCDNIDDCEKRLKTQMPSIGEFVNFKGNNSINNSLANVSFVTEFDVEKYDYVLNSKDISSQDDENEELKRLAENINFAYVLNENERANFEKITKEMNIYNLKSSYASAVHIASKLKYCEKLAGNENKKGLDVLVAAINAGKAKSEKVNDNSIDIYNKLVVLEHRRWMAYTISEGWKKPTKDELDIYLYREGNTHIKKNYKDEKKDKFHACLYNCNEEPKNLDDEFNKIFNGGKGPDELKNLDDISLYCYKKLCEETKKINIDNYFKLTFDKNSNLIKTDDDNLNLLYHSVVQMTEDVDNSVKLYRNEMKKIKKDYPDLYETLKKDLSFVEERAKKNNFFEIDARLINFIPFCLWYRKKYKAVITISDRNVVDDIAVPILLGAEHHTVLLKTKKGYGDKINTFLRSYYDTDKIDDIIKIDIKDSKYLKNDSAENSCIKNYQDAIDERISYFTNRENILEEDIVINVVPNATPESIMALEKYKNKHPIVSYRQSGIKCYYDNMMNDYYKIGDINLSVDEWLQLCGWEITEQGYGVMPCNKMDKLSEEVFWKASNVKKDKDKRYTIWEKMYECYKGSYKSSHKSNDTVKVSWHNPGHSDLIKNDLKEIFPDFLKILESEKIIKNLKSSGEQTVDFNINDINAYSILANLSGTFFENIVYYKCKFSTLFYEVRTGVKIKVKEENKKDKSSYNTNNEIDVIAINGIKPIFISCKTTAELKLQFVYEIHSEAKLFGGIPVLAVAQTLAENEEGEIKSNHEFLTERAKDWGVSLLDANIIKDDEKFNKAMKRILAGEIVSPLDDEFHTKQEDKK